MYAILSAVGTSLRLDSASHCCVVDRSVASLENVWGCGVGETPNQVSLKMKKLVSQTFLSGDTLGWGSF